MDKLKKARAPIRGLITRTVNEVDLLLLAVELDELQLNVKHLKLNDLLEKIQNVDHQILEFLMDDYDETIYNSEVLDIDKYYDEISLTKLKIERRLRKFEKNNDHHAPSEYSLAASANCSTQRKFKLPKIELKKYSGKLLDWLSWWGQFEKIHEDKELHATDKFQYLKQSMEDNSRPKEIVEGFPATEENYPKAIKALTDRFGKTKLLIQVYVRELFQLGLKNLNKKVEITSMYDKLLCHVRSLESLGVTLEQAALFLYPMVESSLPEDTLIAWQRSSLYEKDGSQENPPKNELDYLLQFLGQEVEHGEQRTLVKSGYENKEETVYKKQKESKNQNVPTADGLFNGQAKSKTCVFCDKQHESKDCAATEFWPMEDLKKKIQEKRACFICLRQSHSAKECRSFVKCHVCSKKHFTIMCPDIREKKVNSKSISGVSASGSNFDCCQDVLLKTVMVLINFGAKDQKKLARVLFDDGSQRSYITTSMTKAIKSTPFNHEYIRNVMFDGSRTACQKVNNHMINVSSLDGIEKMTMVLREKLVLGGKLSRVPKGFWLDQLKEKGILVNDIAIDNEKVSEIDLVIGSDYWGSVMLADKVTLPCGLTANNSLFGWSLSGVVPNRSQVDHSISMFQAEENLNKMWSLELIGITDPIEKLSQVQEETAAKEIFLENVKRDNEGRYEVKLPWVSSERVTPNKKMAISRLVSATKKLNVNKKFDTYADIIKSWLDEGFIEKVKDSDEDKTNCHYLPHHPVFKDSHTTPVRPVFDASCKTAKNLSLNDCLFKGPNCIELLPSVLMRFRLKEVGGASDIRKAFQMIDVEIDDREYLRFLWWEDSSQTIMVSLRHCRVVFGLICSPFLLAAVLEMHLKNVNESYREIAYLILKSLYVDNCITSFDSHEEYENFKRIATEILAEAKMELREWECSFKQDDEIASESETKVLGMIWDKRKDNLSIKVPTIEIPDKLTKRNIASALHKFFDPIGYTCPAILQMKIILQQAWKTNVSWDSELPVAWKDQFSSWCGEAHLLKEIKISRLCQIPNSTNRQLHTFTDACQDAFTAVVFLRTEFNGKVEIQLIQSKSRIAPIGKATINRLELLGCLIGARLAHSVMEALELVDVQRYFWSDSTTAIAWIQRNNEWGTFVNNRVKRIREITDLAQWRHVPGILNPADLPSRGCSPSELLRSKWWEGPSWLRLNSNNWPNNKIEVDEEKVNSEKKKESTVNMFSVDIGSWFKTKFNKHSTNVKVMAWMRRFCHNAKKSNTKKSQTYLTIQELRDAEMDIIRVIQQETELGGKEEKQIKRCMSPTTINERGVLRLRTPVTSEGFRYPYLLPRTHPRVLDLIMEAHIIYCHAGSQFLMAKLREKYWITQARKTISSVCNSCIICKKNTAKKMKVSPIALPENRVKSGEIFDSTGVDLFGHLTLKNGTKVWVVLYTCAVYRAIHLDVVDSISTKAFVKSLKKFIYQFGRPTNMMSDNGTNFSGTANLFKMVDKEKLKEECNLESINWNFIPPAAPWWGGFWERLVRSVKEPLRKMLGRSVIDFEQLQMMLMEIQSVINDRPLTTVTEDPDDLEPLTPAMFLRGTKNCTSPEEKEITGQSLQKEWLRIQDLKGRLQARFRQEYLGQLVEHKKANKSSIINVGDIVLLENSNKKRYQWPMGRIFEIMPSSDGEVRVAKIKIKTGCIIRPLDRLYPLELSQSNSRPIIADEKSLELQATVEKENIEEDMGNDDLDNEEQILDKEEFVLMTRSGRKINKPKRYDAWNK